MIDAKNSVLFYFFTSHGFFLRLLQCLVPTSYSSVFTLLPHEHSSRLVLTFPSVSYWLLLSSWRVFLMPVLHVLRLSVCATVSPPSRHVLLGDSSLFIAFFWFVSLLASSCISTFFSHFCQWLIYTHLRLPISITSAFPRIGIFNFSSLLLTSYYTWNLWT